MQNSVGKTKCIVGYMKVANWLLQEGAGFMQTLCFFPNLIRCESIYQYLSSFLRF